MARAQRDRLELADKQLWSAILSGETDTASSRERYEQAVRQAEVLGFCYRPGAEVAQEPLEEIVRRIQALPAPGESSRAIEAALLGSQERHRTTLAEALDVYVNEIAKADLRAKSPGQKKRWLTKQQWAVRKFIEVIGDKPLEEISRDDARAYYRHWLELIAPEDPEAEQLSASTGNRAIGLIRVLYGAYFSRISQADRPNPFRNMTFGELDKGKRPPFSVDWIQSKILVPGGLKAMNSELRGITLALIETGARLSELCNLPPSAIRLNDPVPHICIHPSFDKRQPRELKSTSSARLVPLVGIALKVFEAHQSGFPRYFDRESSLSAAMNKFLRENGLLPTKKHSAYSFRHAFEDRMKEAGVDFELRCILMGHRMDRPAYGEGGSLSWQRDQLQKIALPFDPTIV